MRILETGHQVAITRLPLAPAEFVAECVEEAALAEAHQIHRVFGAVAADFVPEVQLKSCLSIDGEQALGRDAFDANGQARISADNDGTQSEQMRTDGRDYESIDVGREDGAIRCQCVGSGAGRRGDDDTVGAKASNAFSIEIGRASCRERV